VVEIDDAYYQTKVYDVDELKQRMLSLWRCLIIDAIKEWRGANVSVFVTALVLKKDILSIYVDSSIRVHICANF